MPNGKDETKEQFYRRLEFDYGLKERLFDGADIGENDEGKMAESSFLKQRALELWREGEACHWQRDFERAVALYDQSIELFPTAEAYTFRGWANYHMDRIDEAIADCRKAIEIEPEFGNPYNDIGSYLVAQGNSDEAIQWFTRAKHAERYEARHFPYINLGRIFADRGMVLRAVSEFEKALVYSPGDNYCLVMLAKLKSSLN